MNKPTISLKTKFALFITIVLWASAFVGIRQGLLGFTPGPLGLLRFITAALAMLIICVRLPKREKMTFRDKILLLLLGAVTLGGYHLALNYGELTVPSGTASFIISQMPIITTILAIAFLGERLNGMGIIGMFVSFVGMAFIMLGKDGKITFDDFGVVEVFIAAVCGSIYSVFQKPFLKKYHAIEVTAYVIWGTMLPFFYYWTDLTHEIITAPLSATLSAVYLGIFPGAIAYLGWSYALAEMPASRAANFMYFMPVIATFLGWICLGEVLAGLSLLGGLIALLGVWMVNESYKRQSQATMLRCQS